MKKKFIAGMITALICAFALTIVYLVPAVATTPTSKTTAKKTVKVDHPKVQITMADGKIMVVELYPEYAPETVANFVKLVKAKFYDGLKFHRIVQGFMIQGGDPNGNGTGGAEKTIKGEFTANGFKANTLKHVKGVISMARIQENNSASSQFFIMDGTAKYLDGSYAAFGKLIAGEKTLDSLVKTPVGYNEYGNEKSTPLKDVIIKKMTILGDKK